MLMGKELRKTVEFHKTLDDKNLIAPELPENMRKGKEVWLNTANLFDEIFKEVNSGGLK